MIRFKFGVKKFFYIISFLFIMIFFIVDQIIKNMLYLQFLKNKDANNVQHIYLNSGFSLYSSNSFLGIYFFIIFLLLFLLLSVFIIFLIKRYKIFSLYFLFLIAIWFGVFGNIIDRFHTSNFSVIDWICINQVLYLNLSDLLLFFGVIGLIFAFLYNNYVWKNGKND